MTDSTHQTERFFEANFDGLIGPNHNYGGLAFGNLASSKNAQAISHPKEAALQGLEKMRTLLRLGYKQGLMLPQLRPDVSVLRALGYEGTDHDVIESAGAQHPELLNMVYSASSMWAANAATVTPSRDASDGKVHFTPANLVTTAHRAIEHTQTQKCLNAMFSDPKHFSVHPALPSINRFADEGAANHTRLANHYGDDGLALFVYGRNHETDLTQLTFPARQTQEACEAIARQHQHKLGRSLYLAQSAKAINAGAFHNDVVAVGNGPVLFYHQDAYEPASQAMVFTALNNTIAFKPVEVPREKVSLSDAIKSYLFNSQLLASPEGRMDEMTLIAPTECLENENVKRYLDELITDETQPIRHVEYVDVRQSMSNGGGPACLRLRVLLNETEWQAVNPAFVLTEEKIDALQTCVRTHYRDDLAPQDLLDPTFADECRVTLHALADTLGVPEFYMG